MAASWQGALRYSQDGRLGGSMGSPVSQSSWPPSTHTRPNTTSQLIDTLADREASSAPRSGASGPADIPKQTRSKESNTAKPLDIDQKRLQAERIWWSEASERQVRELEGVFGAEFEKTTQKLRVDIDGNQDRLEGLLAAETQQRNQALSGIHRELDNHKALISQLQEQIARQNTGPATKQATTEEPNGVQELLIRLQGDLDSTRAETASFMSEWEEHKAGFAAKAAAIEDLRRDLAAADEQRQLEITRIDDLVKELGNGVEVTRQQRPDAASREDLQSLRTVMLQSAEALGHGIEEVSVAVTATEQKLKLEFESLCRKVQEVDAKQCKEVLDALSASSDQLTKKIADECEQRALEANVLKTRLDAVTGWMEDMQSRHATLRDELQITSKKLSEPQPESVPRAGLDQIRSQVETLRTEISQLERGFREELLDYNEQAQRGAQNVAALGERVVAAEELAIHAAAELTEERSVRSAAVAEARRYAEDVAGRAQAVIEASNIQQVAAQQGSNVEITNESLTQILTQVTATQELRSDLAMLKSGLQEVDASCKHSSVAIARAEAEIRALEEDCQKCVSLLPRVESMEQKARNLSAASMRLEAMEADLQRAAQETDLRRVEDQLRRAAQELVPLTSRIEVAEADARMVSREVVPIGARITAVESEVQRLARDAGPALSTLEALKAEMNSVKARMMLLQTTVASAPSEASSEAPSRVNTYANSKNVPQAIPSKREAPAASPLLPMRGEKAGSAVTSLASRDLTASINNLVRKVNTTLVGSSREPTLPDVSAAGGSMPSTPVAPPVFSTEDVPTQAIKAVEDLQKQNMILRERNAGLMEEILSHDETLTPGSFLVDGRVSTSSSFRALPRERSVTASPTVQATPQLFPGSPACSPSGGSYAYPPGCGRPQGNLRKNSPRNSFAEADGVAVRAVQPTIRHASPTIDGMSPLQGVVSPIRQGPVLHPPVRMPAMAKPT